jgi:cyclin A
VEDFCYITDNTYTRLELLTMESDILKLLDFESGSPAIKTFLRWCHTLRPHKSSQSLPILNLQLTESLFPLFR